jgi:predicted ATPase/class 3 adenylate cyclase
MKCAKCGAENRVGRKFCAKCAARLASWCLGCGAANEPGEDFCGECGAALDNAVQAAAAADTVPVTPSANGERRHLTVLFCDLVGSTEIAAQLDPEEWREVVASYHRATAEAIARYGGNVGKYLGDGLMAYFGWPTAHDNDAERAARSGLAILEAVLKLNHDASRPKLAARVGIDSGSVVVGAGANNDADVFGETPNIAARVQALAAPGSVLITAATHRLLSGLFVVEERGLQKLKGVANPVGLYRLERATGVRGRLAAARGLTPFVGRAEELRLLLSRWEQTLDGEGQLVLVVGEAGIGKSRLVAEFHDHIRDTPHIWIESAGEQLFENTPFQALSEMLSRWLELEDATNLDEQYDRIERALVSARLKVAEVAPLIADLLQLPVDARYPRSTLTAEQKRRRLLAALSDWVLAAGTVQPLTMMVEDLHWLDPSTLELLQILAEQSATSRLMLLCTARPEFRAPWPMHTHHNQITLNRLSSRNVREMVALVAARNSLASKNVEAVVERAVGVPLFVEELTGAVLESGNAGTTSHEIPATLHDSLMARLDRLGPAKEVIQIGAVIGGEFSYGLLHAVDPISDEELQSCIRRASDAELVYVRGIPPDATYQFKHALIRDAAYEALLKTRRKELHLRIAQVLVEQFPERVKSAPELLARHYTEAGRVEQAASYLEQAGRGAAQRSANAEAITHLTKALQLLRTLPDTPTRARQELTIHLGLGVVLIATKGFAASEVESTYARARELCQQIGETEQLFPVLYGLWGFYLVGGQLRIAREIAEQLLIVAQGEQDASLLLQAHYTLGVTLFSLGELQPALKHIERCSSLYDPREHHSLAFKYGSFDTGVATLSFKALILWLLGYPDQALKKIQETLVLAHELGHPFSLAQALVWTTWFHQYRRDDMAAREQAETVIRLSTEQGFSIWLAIASIFYGWALSMQGQRTEGIARLQRGLANFRATGAEADLPRFLALLAEAYCKIDQKDDALSALADALAQAEKTENRNYQAELYRLKGTLIAQTGVPVDRSQEPTISLPRSSSQAEAEAEECFHRAIDVARRQAAKSLELRAVTRLARLWQQQGKREEARNRLAEIYDWFTEGFDTPDLKEAKALLEELT